MAEFAIHGQTTVAKLKREFKKTFGATLRVYKGVGWADDDATIGSLRSKEFKGSKDFNIRGNMLVGTFTKSFLKELGVKVRVADKNDSELAPDNITIAAAGKL